MDYLEGFTPPEAPAAWAPLKVLALLLCELLPQLDRPTEDPPAVSNSHAHVTYPRRPRILGRSNTDEQSAIAYRIALQDAVGDRLPGPLGTLSAMVCRISELVIDAADPNRLAAFWGEALGYVELGRDEGAIEIGPPVAGFGGPQPTLVFVPSSDPRTGKLRLHIDVNATDRDQDAELERLLALGARPADVGQVGTESWHVLADPEGNEFCLLRTRLQPL
jgi:hypothetical protein